MIKLSKVCLLVVLTIFGGCTFSRHEKNDTVNKVENWSILSAYDVCQGLKSLPGVSEEHKEQDCDEVYGKLNEKE